MKDQWQVPRFRNHSLTQSLPSQPLLKLQAAGRMLRMRQWQKDALKVIREARAHAIRTTDSCLHLACSRTIEAMVMNGGQVPADLRIYASQTRELYGT
jgi:hypothetical protein